MIQKQTFHYLLLFVILLWLTLPAFAGPVLGHKLTVSVTDASNKEPIVMGSVQLQPLGSNAVTDMDGKATITNIPDGNYQLVVSYVGYVTSTTQVKVSKDVDMHISTCTFPCASATSRLKRSLSPPNKTRWAPVARSDARPSTTCRPHHWLTSCSSCPDRSSKTPTSPASPTCSCARYECLRIEYHR